MIKLPKTRQELVDMYIECLEEGKIPWEKMWKTSIPENGITGIKYRGVNNLYLSYITEKRGYNDNRWITYNQMIKNKWKFIKEAKGQGVTVEYWGMKNKLNHKIYNFEEYRKIIEKDPDKESEFKIHKMSYTVFNGDLIDGLVNSKKEQEVEIISNDYVKNIIDNLGVKYIEKGDEAYYIPKLDQVVLPPAKSFETNYSYYATQLHELSHSTGHESRLCRNLNDNFGSEEYAKEELRAEISSSFLMQRFHLEADERHLNNHKSYVKNWLEILKNNPQELFNAITESNQIVDYLEANSIEKTKTQSCDIELKLEMEYE
mgnify:FL=1